MHDKRLLIEDRLDRFIRERLAPALYRDVAPLEIEAWHVPGEPVPFAEAVGATFEPFVIGDPWGRPWSTSWFRVRGDVPAGWDGEGLQPELVVDLGFNLGQSGFQAEGLIWRSDGTIVKAISPYNAASAGAVDGDGRVDVLLEVAANPDVGSDWSFSPTVVGDLETAGTDVIYSLGRLELGLLDLTVWHLLQDVHVLRGLMLELPQGYPRRAEILVAFERMVNAIDPHDVAGTAAAGRDILAPVLAKGANASAHELHAVGHAHIDSAWLWPIRETIRKCARTFSNVIALMDENPDFVFACSSAQQLAWIKEYYPELFERIREKVAGGQFVPVGGMWVESDTNLPGSEAMARQFVAGKQFFLREFGVDTEEVWLPDSFGYSGALPQIVKAAGAKWFLTQKISWNESNVMPHHTFLWEGIDGTRVFTHFPPVDKYNSDLSAADLAHAETNYRDHGRGTMSLVPYGYGDGGGGPTREMIAVIDRTGSLEGSPRVIHSTPQRFFESAEAEYPDPEVWTGELYLELHRGTYTSQLKTKQGNRRSEHLLREAELWATAATVRTGAEYPYDRLEKLWQLVLLQQFHDILPGSAIAWVHHDAERNYAHIAHELGELIQISIRQLVGSGTTTVALNAAPHGRGGAPALGGGPVQDDATLAPAAPADAGFVLDNGLVRARLSDGGLLTELVDIASGRDVIPPGQVGNLFQLHRDTPAKWDAWDIDYHYREVVTDLVAADVRLDADGAVIVEHRFGASTITERLSLAPGSRELDIALEVDWNESQKLLKLAFPIDVHAERFSSEIQFGHIERPTHTNTSWDAARFETSAHRWIHVGEPGFGVAIVNDSTYGYDVTRRPREGGGSTAIARLSIIRAALFPDPEQDQGLHKLRVGVVVDASIQDAVTAGYRKNLDTRVVRDAAVDAVEPIIRVSNPGVVVEAVKLAEDRSGDVIVRLYEALGQRATATLAADFPVSGVLATDLLEREIAGDGTVEVTPDGVGLSLRPFQLVTLRLAR